MGQKAGDAATDPGAAGVLDGYLQVLRGGDVADGLVLVVYPNWPSLIAMPSISPWAMAPMGATGR